MKTRRLSPLEKQRTAPTMNRRTTGNSTFAISGVSCSAGSLAVAESFVIHKTISGENSTHRKSAKSYV